EELTSGIPDLKEGIYFGSEDFEDDTSVRASDPLRGRNQYPEIAGYRGTVLAYIDALTALSRRLIDAMASALGCDSCAFAQRYVDDPTILLRVFNYPSDDGSSASWGVGEHSDYGLLTLLKQDSLGGLQVKHESGWIDVPDVAGSFVVNVGDVLESLTG